MYSKYILTLVFSAFFFVACSQSNKEKLFLQFTSIQEVITKELQNEANPLNIEFKENTIRELKNGQLVEVKSAEPISFQRDSVNYLPLTTNYHYNIQDLVVTSIIYDWERYKNLPWNKKKKLLQNEINKEDIYLSELNRIRNNVIEVLGLKNGYISKTHSGKIESWKNENIKITIELIYSKGTCRIRLWLKQLT